MAFLLFKRDPVLHEQESVVTRFFDRIFVAAMLPVELGAGAAGSLGRSARPVELDRKGPEGADGTRTRRAAGPAEGAQQAQVPSAGGLLVSHRCVLRGRSHGVSGLSGW